MKRWTVHQVTGDDTLSGIAEEYYGRASWWQKIAEANPDTVKGPRHVLREGMRLHIPLLHDVRVGDTLSELAKTFLGSSGLADFIRRVNPGQAKAASGVDEGPLQIPVLYTVRSDDESVWQISQRFYGKNEYSRIKNANLAETTEPTASGGRRLKKPGKGTVLLIPAPMQREEDYETDNQQAKADQKPSGGGPQVPTKADPTVKLLKKLEELVEKIDKLTEKAGGSPDEDWDAYKEAVKKGRAAQAEAAFLSGRIAGRWLGGSVPVNWEVTTSSFVPGGSLPACGWGSPGGSFPACGWGGPGGSIPACGWGGPGGSFPACGWGGPGGSFPTCGWGGPGGSFPACGWGGPGGSLPACGWGGPGGSLPACGWGGPGGSLPACGWGGGGG